MICNSEIIDKGIDTSDATATSADIISGKTAYSNGQKIIGELSCTKSESAIFTFNWYQNMEFSNAKVKVFDASFLTANKALNLGDIVSFQVSKYIIIGIYMQSGKGYYIKCITNTDDTVILGAGASYSGMIYRTGI